MSKSLGKITSLVEGDHNIDGKIDGFDAMMLDVELIRTASLMQPDRNERVQ